MRDDGLLIILAGLPGTGKTTLARRIANEIGAVYLRIDTIEHALETAGRRVEGPEGYVVAYALADENLRLGHTVVADSVNPLRITRQSWRDVAVRTGKAYREIEVVCSNPVIHRSRVETRQPDIDGFRLPTWEEVASRPYEPWDTAPIVIDTAGQAVDDCVAEALACLRNDRG